MAKNGPFGGQVCRLYGLNDASGGPFTAFHRRFTAFHRRFTAFYYVSSPFYCRFTAFHRRFTVVLPSFHRVLPCFTVISPSFHRRFMWCVHFVVCPLCGVPTLWCVHGACRVLAVGPAMTLAPKAPHKDCLGHSRSTANLVFFWAEGGFSSVPVVHALAVSMLFSRLFA